VAILNATLSCAYSEIGLVVANITRGSINLLLTWEFQVVGYGSNSDRLVITLRSHFSAVHIISPSFNSFQMLTLKWSASIDADVKLISSYCFWSRKWMNRAYNYIMYVSQRVCFTSNNEKQKMFYIEPFLFLISAQSNFSTSRTDLLVRFRLTGAPWLLFVPHSFEWASHLLISFNRLEDRRTVILFLSMDGGFGWKINEPAFKR
jgi:hypothetical protein